MRINPTQSGGRMAQGDTPYGKFRVEWDRHGNLISQQITIREPDIEAQLEREGYDPNTAKHRGCCDPPGDE